jgi:hypothetical protein
MNLRVPKPASTALYGLSILIYFLRLSGGGIHTGFSHDDLMNMYRAWVEPLPRLVSDNLCFFLFPSSYRPFGGLFYHLFFNGFGFNPVPFRLLILLFLLANIYLTYAFVRRLTASSEVAVITALLHCYHVSFMPLYRNTGTCYDIFCFFFYLAAFLYYIRIRQQGRLLRPIEQLAFLGLLVCALNAKEIAVTLPVLIGVYEALYYPPLAYRPRSLTSWVSWLYGNGRVMCWGILIDVAFLSGKVYGTNGIGRQGGYITAVSLHKYIHSLQHDLNEIFFTYGTSVFRDRNLALLLLGALLVAWRSKSVSFRFSLLFWQIGVLPVAFIPSRGIYAVYIPLVGFAACAAIAWVKVRDLFSSRVCRMPPALAFLLLVFVMASFYHMKGADRLIGMDIQAAQISSVINGLRTTLPSARKGARMLFLKDPFDNVPNAVWASYFITHLLYRDNTIELDHIALMPPYDYIFTVEQGRLVLVSPRNESSRRYSPDRRPETPGSQER